MVVLFLQLQGLLLGAAFARVAPCRGRGRNGRLPKARLFAGTSGSGSALIESGVDARDPPRENPLAAPLIGMSWMES